MNDHAGTLKTMIHQRDDGEPCICAECRAVQAAIAALEAGRSGEAGLCREVRELQRKYYGDGYGLHLAMIDWAAKYDAAPQQPPPDESKTRAGHDSVGVDPSKMLRGKVRPGGAFGIATIEVDCADLGPNTIGDGHEILIHNLTKNPLSRQQPAPDEAALQAKADGAFNEYLRGD